VFYVKVGRAGIDGVPYVVAEAYDPTCVVGPVPMSLVTVTAN